MYPIIMSYYQRGRILYHNVRAVCIDFFVFIALVSVLQIRITTIRHLLLQPLVTYIQIASKQRDSIEKTTLPEELQAFLTTVTP